MDSVSRAADLLWAWGALPSLVLAALLTTIALRGAPFRRLGAGFRALLRKDPKAQGWLAPPVATALSLAAVHGAAGAVGLASALALGGPGAIIWLWALSLLLVPLRASIALLTRTSPPGRTGTPKGTLTDRLLADPQAFVRGLGFVSLFLIPLAGVLFYGGVHGDAVRDVGERISPSAGLTVTAAVGGLGALLSVLDPKRLMRWLAWPVLGAAVAIVAASTLALVAHGGEILPSLGQACTAAARGSSAIGGFTGALAGELFVATAGQAIAPLAGALAVSAPLDAEAQSPTRTHAMSAALGPLLTGLLISVLGLAAIVSGAYAERVPDERPLAEVEFLRRGAGFETVSQREEAERRYGHGSASHPAGVRVVEGAYDPQPIEFATARGMIEEPVLLDEGEPMDALLGVVDGRVVAIQKPREDLPARAENIRRPLRNRPLSDLGAMQVRGRMLPTGALLVRRAAAGGGGDATGTIVLVALLVLALIGAVAWGFAIRQTLSEQFSPMVGRVAAALPGLAMVIAGLGVVRVLPALGTITAGLLTIVIALALIVRRRHAAHALGLLTLRAPADPGVPDTKPHSKKRKKPR